MSVLKLSNGTTNLKVQYFVIIQGMNESKKFLKTSFCYISSRMLKVKQSTTCTCDYQHENDMQTCPEHVERTAMVNMSIKAVVLSFMPLFKK